jgi:hypothetical protein
MTHYGTRQIDNRDSEQMYQYLEARIDVLKRRISELETENQLLRCPNAQGFRAANETDPYIAKSLRIA